MRALFDSVILIDALNGIEQAHRVLFQNKNAELSAVSWIEVLAGAVDAPQRECIRNFLLRWPCIPLSSEIAEEASVLRVTHRLRLADAAIYATALARSRVLFTRNTKDFKPAMPSVHIPYSL